MKKSPTALFKILAEQDEDKQMAQIRESLDLSQSGQEIIGRKTDKQRESVWDTTPDDGGAAAAAAATDAPPKPAATAATETAPNGGVPSIGVSTLMKNMLSDLYVDEDRLADFQDVGEGGFATVQRATLTHASGLRQQVAVKRLRAERVAAEQDFSEFIAEANLWRKLRSGDIVKVVGIGAHDLSTVSTMRSSLFVVSEFMEGGMLRDAVFKQMCDPTKQVYKYSDAFRWFVAITRAVKYLHSCHPPIIHRDMKLENVLLTSKELSISYAKVMDLGLHMRGRGFVDADLEGSYYGGTAYNEIEANGSVYRPAPRPASLAEKVRLADMQSPYNPPAASPPRTATKNSSKCGDLLTIAEDEAAEPPEGGDAGDGADAQEAAVEGEANKGAEAGGEEVTQGSDKGEAPVASNGAQQLSGEGLPGSDTPQTGPANAGSDRSNSEGRNTLKSMGYTRQVGSYMYMAPEMVTSNHYSEKVDVFSLSVMLYETLRGHLNLLTIAVQGDPEEVSRYALRVADGHREKLPAYWPAQVKDLIARGWHQDPQERPTAAQFLRDLSAIIDANIPTQMDLERPKQISTACDCGCSIM